MSDRELKPCPFCGGSPIVNVIEPHKHSMHLPGFPPLPDHFGSVCIECSCGCGLIDDTMENVVAHWNRRAIERAVQAETAPSVAKDAARYRWLRAHADGMEGRLAICTWERDKRDWAWSPIVGYCDEWIDRAATAPSGETP